MRRIVSSSFLSRLVLALVLQACSGPLMPSRLYDGLDATFESGSPGFDAQIQPASEGSRRGLRIDVSTPVFSLVFRQDGTQRVARLEWLVRLMKVEGRQVVEERSERDTIYRDTSQEPSLFDRSTYSAFMEAVPGRYVVEIILEDLSSGKSERKELIFELPARDKPLIVTDLWLENQTGEPLTSLFLPDTSETRRAVMYLSGNTSRPVRLVYTLVELDPGNDVAQSPFWQGPGSGFSALNPGPFPVRDSIITETRVVQRGNLVRVAFQIPELGVGTYRIDVHVEDYVEEGAPPVQELTRYFIVRRANFPRLEAYSELIPPLIYLAEAPEWEALEAAMASGGARQEFDRFWGRWMSERPLASRIVNAYFSRVEEANLRYSGFKEGWKTDRGMVYILLGEPLFIEQTLEAEVWYYTYDEGRGERSFVFNRVWRDDVPDMIDEFMLERSYEYEGFWRAEVNRWRTGAVVG